MLQKDEQVIKAVDANMTYIKTETLTNELEIIDKVVRRYRNCF